MSHRTCGPVFMLQLAPSAQPCDADEKVALYNARMWQHPALSSGISISFKRSNLSATEQEHHRNVQ